MLTEEAKLKWANFFAKQALEEAKKLVIEYHMENNKGLYIEQDLSQLPEWAKQTEVQELNTLPKSQPKLSIEDSIIATMHTYTDQILLKKTFQSIAQKNPKIQEHYTAKLSELENQ